MLCTYFYTLLIVIVRFYTGSITFLFKRKQYLLALPLVMLGDPLAGLMVKFQGADDALAVILVDRLCRCRIYRL